MEGCEINTIEELTSEELEKQDINKFTKELEKYKDMDEFLDDPIREYDYERFPGLRGMSYGEDVSLTLSVACFYFLEKQDKKHR